MSAFEIRDMGEAKYFLGLEVHLDRSNRTIKLSEHRMVTERIASYGLTDGKTRSVPFSPSTRLTKPSGTDVLDRQQFPYNILCALALTLLTPWEHLPATCPALRWCTGLLLRGVLALPGWQPLLWHHLQRQ